MKWLGFRMKNVWQEHLDFSKYPYKRLQDIGRKRIKIPNCISNLGFYLLVKFMYKESKIIEALSTPFKLFALKEIVSLWTAKCVPTMTKTESRCNVYYKLYIMFQLRKSYVSCQKHFQTTVLKQKQLGKMIDFFH